MITFRATQPEVFDLIAPKLVPDPELSQEIFLTLMKAYMTNNPADVLVIVVLEDKEVKGFLLSYKPPTRNTLFVHQAWIDSKFSKIHPDKGKELFDMAVEFARENELKAVRFETHRNPRSFIRKFGFKVYGTIMTLELETD